MNTDADVGNATVAWTQISGAMGTRGGNYWSGDNPAKSFDGQWTMDCANDIITLDPPVSKVSEPTSVALVLLGAQRRRKARQG
ncbi:MAG: hypothetical protein Q7J75_00150 [Rhodoferax sp.]|nr:hypothetical protein [Rhodoferax sp.]